MTEKSWVNVEDYTIEHIMPQNEHVTVAWQVELCPARKEFYFPVSAYYR